MFKNFSTIIVPAILIIGLTTVEGVISYYDYNPGDNAYNATAIVSGTPSYTAFIWCVGDNGFVEKYLLTGDIVNNVITITLPDASDYNLTGVSFPTQSLGFIVGYKNSGNDRLKGRIWKTTNGGNNTNDWAYTDPNVFNGVNVPFLNVSVRSNQYGYITCGYGYVLYTHNGDDWYPTPNKPGYNENPQHFPWLYGLQVLNDNSLWVCSDEIRLVAKSIYSGSAWDNYYPLPDDSLAYRNLIAPSYGANVYLAGSKGKDVQLSWQGIPQNSWYPFGVSSQCVHGIAWDPNFIFSAGTGGTFGIGEQLMWYTRNCDFNDLKRVMIGQWAYRVAVGTNRAILIDTDGGELEDTLDKEELLDPVPNFHASDRPDDQGWAVILSWDPVGNAHHYMIYANPRPERELTRPGPGGGVNLSYWWIKTVNVLTTTVYESVLTYCPTGFWIRAYNQLGQPVSILTGPIYGTAIDNLVPPQVTGLGGYYDSRLNAAVLYWNPISSSVEPNLEGYRVCPDVLSEGLNHPALIYRTYYAEKPPNYPRPFQWGFRVEAMDSGGGRAGPWYPTPPDHYLITIPAFRKPNTPYALAFNQGRHLVRVPNTKELHMVYGTDGKIIYTYSTDDGEHWSEEELDNGFYPCISINYEGRPWIAYTKDGDLICKVRRQDGSYKEMLIYDGNENHWAGPPSMALATTLENQSEYAYITYPVYQGEMPENPGPQPPQTTRSYIYATLFDTLDVSPNLLDDDEGDPELTLSHPCVGVTPLDLIHIAWQQGNEIWYITNEEAVTPGNWKEVKWTPKYNISNTEEVSEHPFVEAYGEEVLVVWKEGDPGEIIRRPRVVWYGYDEWGESENLSNSPEYDSDYPQMSTRDVTLWQEVDHDTYKVYAIILGNVSCLTPEANDVSYVHTNVLIVNPKIPEYTVYYCYADEITENELYEVKFDKYEYAPESGGDEEFVYYEGKLGNEVQSPYCQLRTGYVNYGNYKIDYGNRLEYRLKYLNPSKYYLFEPIIYHRAQAVIRQRLQFEDTVANITINPSRVETLHIHISPNSYQEDFQAALDITRTQGAFALLGDFKLYEYEIIRNSGGSGPLSGGLVKLPTTPILQAPRPNPFTNCTEIRFQLPTKSIGDLKIYNSSGRLVNTLISGQINPGYYTMTWNGKDNHGRNQSKGIYFVRLKTNNYDATKKLALIR